MTKLLCLTFILASIACSSSPKRGIASVEPKCLEKTTKKQCTIDIYGDRHCTCVPDEGEMYRTYP